MADNVLTQDLSEPLNGVTRAKVEINAGTGNLTIDSLPVTALVLASGTLQYLENQDVPARSVSADNGQATLTVEAGEARRSWLRLPWDACGGQYDWQIHLNPTVASEITAHSDGGNLRLDLARMPVSRVSADTGGGNIDVVLPENAANLSVTAKTGGGNLTVDIGSGTKGSSTLEAGSGAGNVVVHVPSGIAARVHVGTGLGKEIVDPRYTKVDDHTYQSPGYDAAPDRIEITAKSGAGNVSVDSR
jgi:hypothetical protein